MLALSITFVKIISVLILRTGSKKETPSPLRKSLVNVRDQRFLTSLINKELPQINFLNGTININIKSIRCCNSIFLKRTQKKTETCLVTITMNSFLVSVFPQQIKKSVNIGYGKIHLRNPCEQKYFFSIGAKN